MSDTTLTADGAAGTATAPAAGAGSNPAEAAAEKPILDVRELSVVYESPGQAPVQAVDHVSFT